MKWYRKAADQGHAEAQFYLAQCYAGGVGVGRDEAEATTWFRKAAESSPDNAAILNGYAWQLLTASDEKLRDPKTALPLAQKADELAQHQASFVLDTLALAFCGLSQFS